MKRTGILSCLPLLGADRPDVPVARTAYFEAFRDETFSHMDAVYADARCLTGSLEKAAALTEAAYLRAFSGYGQFRRRRFPAGKRTRSTRDWLYSHLHAAFCDDVLESAAHPQTLIGD